MVGDSNTPRLGEPASVSGPPGHGRPADPVSTFKLRSSASHCHRAAGPGTGQQGPAPLPSSRPTLASRTSRPHSSCTSTPASVAGPSGPDRVSGPPRPFKSSALTGPGPAPAARTPSLAGGRNSQARGHRARVQLRGPQAHSQPQAGPARPGHLTRAAPPGSSPHSLSAHPVAAKTLQSHGHRLGKTIRQVQVPGPAAPGSRLGEGPATPTPQPPDPGHPCGPGPDRASLCDLPPVTGFACFPPTGGRAGPRTYNPNIQASCLAQKPLLQPQSLHLLDCPFSQIHSRDPPNLPICDQSLSVIFAVRISASVLVAVGLATFLATVQPPSPIY